MPKTIRAVAAAEVTTIPVWTPVIEAVSVSVARTAWLPAVFRVSAGFKV